jgi:hypothetical protein
MAIGMSLSLAQLLNCLGMAQATEVAPALALAGTEGAPDTGYAAGTAATTAALLMLAAGDAASAGAREAAAAAAAHGLLGAAAFGRDLRSAALGELLVSAELAGDRPGQRAVLARLAAAAEADFAALGLPVPK